MSRIPKLAIIGLGLLTLCSSLSAPTVIAASSKGSGQALEIAPPLLNLKANPGQNIKATIQLRDVSSSSLVVTNEIDDFVAAGEGGTPKILTGNDSSDPFTVKSWITPLPSFDLAPEKIRTLNLEIHVPANASPGGHYGVIRFSGTPPSLNGTGVSLSASIGALVLLTVNGKLTHQMSVKEFSVNQNGKTGSIFQSTPLNFVVRLQNEGNIQEQPVGHIVVTDMFGKAVAGANINSPPHDVLPSSIRKFTAGLNNTNLGSKHLFGRYHAVLTVSYGGGNQQVITASLTFWIIPYKLIFAILVILIGGFFGLRFMLRRYKQKILSQAQGSPAAPKKQTRTKRKK